MTKVFVVILEKKGYAAMLGVTNKGNPRSKNEMVAQGVRLVIQKRHDSPPFTMVYYTDRQADATFNEELDHYIRLGYTAHEPVVVAMPNEPWSDGERIEVWADSVFSRAKAELSRGWLMREFERARERSARLPQSVRPVVVRGGLKQ